FCLSCGKPVGGSAIRAVSSSSETELYRVEVRNVGRFTDRDSYGYDPNVEDLGGGECIVTNRRIIIQTRKSGTIQIFLRDIVSVEMEKGLFSTSSTGVMPRGFGWISCKQGRELASQIQKAIV